MMNNLDFDDYVDNHLEGAECACSPKGLPHSLNCKGYFPGQDSYDEIKAKGSEAVEARILLHQQFLLEERKNELMWDSLCGKIVCSYELDTGKKWVPGSDDVIAWVEKRFKGQG